MKAIALVNHIAENRVDGYYKPWDTYFPNEDINSNEEVGSDGNRT